MTTTTVERSKFDWLLPSQPDPARLARVLGSGASDRCAPLDRSLAREIRVVPLKSASAAAWDRFVQSAPNATFFHRAGWKEVIQRSFGHSCYFLQAKREGRTTGVLPLVHLRSRLFGNALISNAYGVYGGPVASDDASLAALNQAAEGLAAKLGVDYLEYRLRSPSILPWKRNSELYATFRKRLAPDPETVLKTVPRKRRAMLRKAKALGLKSEVDGDIRRFYGVYSRRVRDLGTPVYPASYFRTLLEVFGSDCEVLTVVRRGRPLSSVIAFHWRDEVLPYYGGGVDEARLCAANDFMYWELMRRACDKGACTFDFGRSKVGTGTFAYKSIWGFEPEPLHHEYLLLRTGEMPNVNPLNPKYAVLIALWRHLPLCIANALGPRISRGLG
jgi:FemAB-related protein (PEP-CTERM system-associated)